MSENIHDLGEKNLPETCFVFKHSTACPVSTSAAKEVKSIPWETPLYWINVIEQRDLSNWIASEFGVKHESPQLLHIEGNQVSEVWNHFDINQKNVKVR